MASDVQQLVVSKLREHSRKPDEMYDKVERLLGGPYIELFARNKRDNWDSWGNEVDKHG
jgi:N6-adenosine-specific RNA methylase IME4